MPPRSIADYLEALPDDQRQVLTRLREVIRAAAPDAEEAFSYGAPAFKMGRPLAAYAAFKKHCSFFPMSDTTLDGFGDEVAPFRTTKGTLQFTPDRPLPAELVTRIVRARLEEIRAEPERRRVRKEEA